MKNCIDILAACGHSLSKDDQILHVLSGLCIEYDSVVVHVTSRVDSLGLSDVTALLLSHEGRIESYTSPVDAASPMVNTTLFQSSQKPNTRFPYSGSSFRGKGRGRNFRGGRRGWNPNSGRPVCQICGVPGHLAEKCCYRFDAEFVPSHHSNGGSSSPSQRYFGSQPHSYCCHCFCSN